MTDELIMKVRNGVGGRKLVSIPIKSEIKAGTYVRITEIKKVEKNG